MKLQEIFNKYSSQDNHFGTDKNTTHSYIETYEKYMNKKSNIDLLEIGIFSGMSLKAWNEYFENSTFVGVDIDIKNLKITPSENIHIVKADATKADIIQLLPKNKKYDYIIDDGSHKIEDIISTFKILHPLMKKNGIYFIEDIQNFDKDIPHLIDVIEPLNYKYEIIDLRSIKNRYDDIMVIVKNVGK